MAEQFGALGVFDSGVGGLTVVRRLIERLPHELIVYLGDTARVPYGTKSPETVIRYADACARTLLQRGIKLLVVACNTASAHALEHLQERLDIPVIGVVEPGAASALRKTRNQRIGVIGTPGTIGSDVYARAIKAKFPDAYVISKACPLFVPLAEEGWTTGDVPRSVATRYLEDMRNHEIDTLILGCTHYPLLAGVIAEVMGDKVAIVDSAEATAEAVDDVLTALDLHDDRDEASYRFLVSDAPDGFARTGRRFLQRDLGAIEWVDF